MGAFVKQFPFYAMIGQILFKLWVTEEGDSPFRVDLPSNSPRAGLRRRLYQSHAPETTVNVALSIPITS